MTFDPKNYPPDWKALGKLVRERAGNRCEHPGCGVANGERGARGERKRWYTEAEIAALDPLYRSTVWLNGTPKLIRIVLTVHHACDCDKRTCRDISHWQLLCQKHHLNADRAHHLEVQAANRRAKRLQRQPELFEGGAVMRGSVEIVSDPDIQGGRYCFAGTRIPVGSIVNYAASAGRDETVAAWGHGLTGEMVDAALAFAWPPQHDAPAVDGEYVHLRCVCGEVTDDLAFGEPIECGYCGRKWRVTVAVEAAEGSGG